MSVITTPTGAEQLDALRHALQDDQLAKTVTSGIAAALLPMSRKTTIHITGAPGTGKTALLNIISAAVGEDVQPAPLGTKAAMELELGPTGLMDNDCTDEAVEFLVRAASARPAPKILGADGWRSSGTRPATMALIAGEDVPPVSMSITERMIQVELADEQPRGGLAAFRARFVDTGLWREMWANFEQWARANTTVEWNDELGAGLGLPQTREGRTSLPLAIAHARLSEWAELRRASSAA